MAMVKTNVKCLNQFHGEKYSLYHGDNVEINKAIPDNSIHYRIFSPPFISLYVFGNSARDMSNCKDDSTFVEQYRYLIKEQFRTHKPGRLLSFHCCNLPVTKNRNGYIGIHDFRGDLIRLYQEEGWIYHSEVCIWKDPVTAMQRSKSIGLLHKQVCKDSSLSRQGIPDYLVTMRKPGVNDEPIAGELSEYHGDNPPKIKTKYIRSAASARNVETTDRSIDIWQRYASPVWMDINPSDTLQYRSARDNNDERHVTPLQLTVIRRGIQLWSNPGDIVMDDFNGIGSSGHVAIEMDRRYIGVELKESYYKASCTNLSNTAGSVQQQLALV